MMRTDNKRGRIYSDLHINAQGKLIRSDSNESMIEYLNLQHLEDIACQ